jgi:transcriptional regulator with XRE-family HTH domain
MKLISAEKLKSWLDGKGRGSLGELAYETKISVHTLTQMAYGKYKSQPGPHIREKLCEATGMSESELFPPAPTGEEEAS